MIGERILNYRIESLLGEGGVGSVYLATHIQLGRKVAIKALNPALVNHPEVRERFRLEATTLSALQHINIVTLYDYLEDERGLFLILEYVPGNPLDNYIRKVSGPIPESKTIYFFNQILDGLAYAHQKGVVHRDIKPSNIIITSDADAKILDFGIAKILKADRAGMTKTGTRMGTVLYMSPEQVKGIAVDARTDVYSLGVTLFEMLTGRCPYDENSMTEFEIYNKIVLEILPRVRSFYPNVSDRMQAIIDKATAKDPNQRFQSCEEFKVALNDANFAYQNFSANPVISNPLTQSQSNLGQTNPIYTQTNPNVITQESYKVESQPVTEQNQFTNKPIQSTIQKQRERNYTVLYIFLTALLLVCGYLIYTELTKEPKPEEKVVVEDNSGNIEDEPIEEEKVKKDPEKTDEDILLDSLEKAKKDTDKLIEVLQKEKKAELLKNLIADGQVENDEIDLQLRISVINKSPEVKFKDIVVLISFFNEDGKEVKVREQELEPLKGGQSVAFKITENNKDLKYKVQIKSAEPFDYEIPPTLDSLNQEKEKLDERIEKIKSKRKENEEF
jgi:serine/threonine protein kinase